jgi:hypothetical protein
MTTYEYTDNMLEATDLNEFRRFRADPNVHWTGMALRGQVDIYDQDSEIDFNCSCVAMEATSLEEDGSSHWFSFIDGPVHWDAPDAPPAWFDDGLQIQWYLYAGRRPATGEWHSAVEGVVTGLTEVYGTIWLKFNASGLRDEETGAVTCDPGGGLALVRSTATGTLTWFDMLTKDDSCVYCAPVGDGEVCVDITPIQDWETEPW